ncbi:hypothetical protein [Microbacterium sp. SY138]|uniref:DUF7657 domain-containing protein n=1 Tax=Microbacterium sp. SY138 TaxID=3149040 RepID=UPI00321B8582
MPREDGLPNRRVLLAPLSLLAAVFVLLVILGITGSSTGVMHGLVSNDADSDLIAGMPEPIRSDEWFVQTTWTISQVEQGLPTRNETFPGGMDATVQHDLPTRDWSTALRPHLVGFLFLPLDQAMAVKWWLPAFALVAAAFLFAVTLLPRRPITALLLSCGFFLAPFFQWWFLSITLYAPAWALLVMAAIVWCVRSRHRTGKWVLAALVAYLTATMGTGIYVPFIVPVVWVVAAFGVGFVLMPSVDRPRFVDRLKAVVPVFIAGAAGVALLCIWLVTRWDTIVGFTSTVYPGERLQPVGGGGGYELAALFSGPFSPIIGPSGGVPWGMNSSESATFVLPGLFLLVPLIWIALRRFRRGEGVDWLTVCLSVVAVVFLAYMFLPGWDPVSHLLLLDRTTYGRVRLGFGLLSLVLVVVAGTRLADERGRGGGLRLPAAVATILAAASVGVAALIGASGDFSFRDFAAANPLVAGATVLCVALFVASVWLFATNRIAVGAGLVLVLSLLSTAGVNPLYRGVLDLRETHAVDAIEKIDATEPGDWVGIADSPLPTMMLVQAGVASYNGFQSAPSPEMWEEIDPTNSSEKNWNRLANVSWVVGDGDPDPRNPAPDQIQLSFDSCSAFAQANVEYVIAESDISQDCVRLVTTTTDGPTKMRIYEVVPVS